MVIQFTVRNATAVVILGAAISTASMAQFGGGSTRHPVHAGPVICVDPGHSAATVGACGRHSAEYMVAWHIARLLRRLLLQEGCSVVLTKQNADQNVTNKARALTANHAHAALFLRLHCDAGSATGAGVYFPDRAGTIRSVRGPPEFVRSESRAAAALFHRAFISSLRGALHDRGIMTDMQTQVGRRLHGALEGSIYARVPVILVEMCVLTNRHDEAFITSARGAQIMARALAAGAMAAAARQSRRRQHQAKSSVVRVR